MRGDGPEAMRPRSARRAVLARIIEPDAIDHDLHIGRPRPQVQFRGHQEGQDDIGHPAPDHVGGPRPFRITAIFGQQHRVGNGLRPGIEPAPDKAAIVAECRGGAIVGMGRAIERHLLAVQDEAVDAGARDVREVEHAGQVAAVTIDPVRHLRGHEIARGHVGPEDEGLRGLISCRRRLGPHPARWSIVVRRP
jgi:hypothetical protein